MSVPVIDPESSVISYPQWQVWEHQFSASGSPYTWTIASGAFPSGLTFQPSLAVTGAESTDILTATDHGLATGNQVRFSALSGGSGLNTSTRYFAIVIDEDSFQLSLTPGGPAVNFTTDITDATLIRPGFVSGAGTVPGLSDVRL